jgi:hypothetical protein
LEENSAETKESKWLKLKRFFHFLPTRAHRRVHNFVLSYFGTVNRKAGKSMKFLAMKLETFEHVDSVIKIFKWVILPATFAYVLGVFCLLGENVLDAALLGVLLFFYSNFLPDLPAVFRKNISLIQMRRKHVCHGIRIVRCCCLHQYLSDFSFVG